MLNSVGFFLFLSRLHGGLVGVQGSLLSHRSKQIQLVRSKGQFKTNLFLPFFYFFLMRCDKSFGVLFYLLIDQF